ncbi:uncharacterized protein LOC110372878 [Helicoverpa armigera]|uniref:uncharacterized protein LOC110372878 n=1 Tax=Helicoverpa armigera TaxID=29058 RepID=UPI003082D5A9
MPLRKVSSCKKDFIDLLHRMAEIINMQLVDYVVEFGIEEVDIYCAGTYKVQLKGIAGGQKIRKNVVVKWHQESRLRACFRESYRREYIFYKRVVPKLLDVQNLIQNEGIKMKFPNCILASDEYNKEVIAVMGLKEDGYELRDRLCRSDMSYVTLVIKNMAKMHALSFILERTNPTAFEEIARLCNEDVQYREAGPPPKCMKSYYEASVKAVLDENARYKLQQLTPDIRTILYKCTLPDKYSTICHGDCWNNNIMYKHKGRKPVEVIFVDYQLMRLASPVTDISYFLYMSTDGPFLNKHYDQVINIYYGTLTAVLRHCNLDVEDVYPWSIFQKHLKEYSVLGLIEALVSMMIITAPYDDALKMTEMKYEQHDEEVCEDECRHSSLFVERVNGIVDDFFERQYSLDAIFRK